MNHVRGLARHFGSTAPVAILAQDDFGPFCMCDKPGNRSWLRPEHECNVPAKNILDGFDKRHTEKGHTKNGHTEKGYINDVATDGSKVTKVQKTNDDAGANNYKQKNDQLKMKAQQRQNANYSIYREKQENWEGDNYAESFPTVQGAKT